MNPYVYHTLSTLKSHIIKKLLLFTPNYHDGVIQQLITTIPVADFDVAQGGQVEIIGWLYQYYNTEPKDLAFKKKKYAKTDIPAVTQLFTPDWIVKYMVQNSLGRYWIDVLKSKGDTRNEHAIANAYGWQYYMPAADQSAASTIKINSEQNDLSNVEIEDITLIDAATGSGHILVYAFDVFMQFYENEGFSKREAAQLIIKKNIFGFDIDTRAFQLTYFSLVMKAREFDRRFLNSDVQPKVFDIPETADLSSADFHELIKNSIEKKELDELLAPFQYGNNYGSLIHFKSQPNWKILDRIATEQVGDTQLSFDSINLEYNQAKLSRVIKIAKLLNQEFTVGVMNPPYMGSSKMNLILKKYVESNFPDSKSDLFAAFMERLRMFVSPQGYYSMITQHAWMFLSSYEKLRKSLRHDTFINMAHLGTRAFEEIGGEVVQSTTFVLKKQENINYVGTYERLVDFDSQSKKETAYLEAVKDNGVNYLYRTNQANFSKIPGNPIAYWASDNLIHDFEIGTPMDDLVDARQGLATADNKRFLRMWYEVANQRISFHSKSIDESIQSNKKWFPCNKGGAYRKWYGNYDYVVNWENDGYEIRNFNWPNGKQRSVIRNPSYYFREAITWSDITSGTLV
ncbi:BREX-1 system adenine-specific DNA-methyltransferase PglX [Lactobacillus sp. CBA3606]|uniref:BREX-1 system adenine-specific DNA-methyltransferase PglX n=1 Tax=Lactobacillus sp. CBA3606 TaxID=2099789 RepID=UPI00131A2221|nr:BREX-1 system adenine-specific DNA-methyltransferase PglX [Lactobacillus sp. CBA3606]